MGRPSIVVVGDVTLAVMGGWLFLAYGDFPVPKPAVEKVLPDARFPKWTGAEGGAGVAADRGVSRNGRGRKGRRAVDARRLPQRPRRSRGVCRRPRQSARRCRRSGAA